ncbi:MAG: hypothetical protein B7Y80_05600 [Hyphomicrobium sp. 32-62-53]|nr:MAG: hypothetical protein B7Z29_11330 [Hyphomicrobium sp. 12-62-95]OYY00717.1 MAG: hypothetical protein B7Y80_05600 [Hyphomicrobium sp. 32-62-53]
MLVWHGVNCISGRVGGRETGPGGSPFPYRKWGAFPIDIGGPGRDKDALALSLEAAQGDFVWVLAQLRALAPNRMEGCPSG